MPITETKRDGIIGDLLADRLSNRSIANMWDVAKQVVDQISDELNRDGFLCVERKWGWYCPKCAGTSTTRHCVRCRLANRKVDSPKLNNPTHEADDHCNHLPTEAEIRAECEKIQAEWTEHEREKRTLKLEQVEALEYNHQRHGKHILFTPL